MFSWENHDFFKIAKTATGGVLSKKACNVIKKRLQHRCFPVNIAKFSRAPILKNIRKQLLQSYTKEH